MSRHKWTAFQLIDSERELRISEHRFYIDQAKSRLLSQFANIEAEVDQAKAEHWERCGEIFGHEWYDLAVHVEAVRDHGIEFYQLLSDMHERTRLSVVAGMYHHWDKTFRRFLGRELKWARLVIGDNTRRALWALDSAKLEHLLRALGLDIRKLSSFERMDAMRLVVNVFKHGEGKSLAELRQNYPEFLYANSIDLGIYDDTDLTVSDVQVEEFSNAIELFWRELPGSVTFDGDTKLDVPKEFEKAWNSDLG